MPASGISRWQEDHLFCREGISTELIFFLFSIETDELLCEGTPPNHSTALLNMPTICFIVHGIGTQDQQFAEPLQRGVHVMLPKLVATEAKQLGITIDAKAVSDSVFFKPLYWANVGSAEQTDLYRRIYPELYGPRSFFKSAVQFFHELGLARDVSITLIGDIFSYLGRFEEAIKRTIFSQVKDTLAPHLAAHEPVSLVVVGHSLGSVIVHDLLSSLVKYGYPGFEVLLAQTSIITMGSPISLFSLASENTMPTSFLRWTNIRHFWDPIAFPVKPRNEKVQEEKVSAFAFWKQPGSWKKIRNPHTIYWTHPKVHRLIAREIVKHYVDAVPKPCTVTPVGEPPLEVFNPGNRATAEAGLTQYCSDFNNFSFGEHITNATEIDICVVYGSTWIGTNQSFLTTALGRTKTTIRVCMVDPDGPAMDGLCRLFGGISKPALAAKITGAKDRYIEATAEAKRRFGTIGRMQIYYSMNPPCHGFYRFDNQLFVTPRPTSGSRAAASPMPMMIYRRTSEQRGLFNWTMNDFNLLVVTPNESRLVYDSATV